MTRHAASLESLISLLMSICSVHEFHRTAQCSVNLLQCTIICFTVFLTWSHRQTDDEKLKTWVLFRKTASSLQLIWIYMIMKFFVFCSCAWSLTVLWLRNLTLSKFQFRNLLIQWYFYLCINACFADTFIFFQTWVSILLTEFDACSL